MYDTQDGMDAREYLSFAVLLITLLVISAASHFAAA